MKMMAKKTHSELWTLTSAKQTQIHNEDSLLGVEVIATHSAQVGDEKVDEASE